MRKFLSLILAMMLVVGLLPAAFASDAPPVTGYTYVFKNAAHTTSASVTGLSKFAENGASRGVHTLETTVPEVSAPWGYVAESTSTTSNGIGSDNACARISVNRTGGSENPADVITFNPQTDDKATALCLEISVAKGGEFVPTFSYAAFTYGPTVELYLTPKSNITPTGDTLSDYIKALAPSCRLGVADTSTGASKTFRPIKLSAGNYYFIIVLNGENSEVTEKAIANKIRYHYCQPQSLSLLPLKKAFVYDISSNALVEGYAETINNELKNDSGLISVLMPKVSAFVSPATVDTTKTSPWSVGNTRYVYNKINSDLYGSISENGTRMFLTTARYWTLSNNDSKDSDDDSIKDTLPAIGMTAHTIFVLDVPAAGTYKLKMHNNVADEFGSYTRVSFGPAAKTKYSYGDITTLYNSANNNILGWHDSAVVHNGTNANPAEEFEVTVANAGKYYVLFTTAQESLDKNSMVAGANYQTLNLSKIILEEVVDEDTVYPGDEEINVNPENATAAGKATISNEMSAIATDTDGKTVDAEITTIGDSVTAPETVGDYEFLYWAKGIGYNKKIVTHDATYNYNKESQKLWLTAVYRNTKTAVENAIFYNVNGDVLKTVAISDGNITTPSLDKVSLAGYGKASGWKDASNGIVYGEGEEISVSKNALFVAEYDEAEDSIAITVVNGTMSIENGKEAAQFGDKITVTAPLRKDNTKLFNYWKKGDEIVSFDKTYEFCAWEDCTLTAIYSDYVPVAETVRKIILGSIGDTYVAEFIGFDGDDVLERGIAFGISGAKASVESINRVVMNLKELNHLAAIDDIDADDVVGYVIDKSGNVYYSK